jgi:hypothetical protein
MSKLKRVEYALVHGLAPPGYRKEPQPATSYQVFTQVQMKKIADVSLHSRRKFQLNKEVWHQLSSDDRVEFMSKRKARRLTKYVDTLSMGSHALVRYI